MPNAIPSASPSLEACGALRRDSSLLNNSLLTAEHKKFSNSQILDKNDTEEMGEGGAGAAVPATVLRLWPAAGLG